MKHKKSITAKIYDTQSKILTIPNVLSFFRLCLIPLFLWLYCAKQAYFWTSGVLILSGITDVMDGFIARRFHMTSNLGKALDPIADKLTQGAMMICLVSHFPLIWVTLILLIVKEIIAGIMGICVIKKTGQVYGSQWHGKIATFLLYAMMVIHVVWHDIPKTVSDSIIVFCIIMMLISAILYSIRNYRAFKNI